MLRSSCCIIKDYVCFLRIAFIASCHGRLFSEKDAPVSIGYEVGLYQVSTEISLYNLFVIAILFQLFLTKYFKHDLLWKYIIY